MSGMKVVGAFLKHYRGSGTDIVVRLEKSDKSIVEAAGRLKGSEMNSKVPEDVIVKARKAAEEFIKAVEDGAEHTLDTAKDILDKVTYDK